MPTMKKRINMCVPLEHFEALSSLAKSRKTSCSSLAWQLVEEALEMYEDKWLMELIREHESGDDKKRISGNEVFERCGLI